MFPAWVEKHHRKGTYIREIDGRYYLYRVSSKRVEDKPYPVCSMEYLGRIMERGLIKPLRTSFTPGVDSIMLLSSVTENISDADRKVLDGVGVISGGDRYYSGKLTQEQLKVTEKYFVYSNGTLEARQRES